MNRSIFQQIENGFYQPPPNCFPTGQYKNGLNLCSVIWICFMTNMVNTNCIY